MTITSTNQSCTVWILLLSIIHCLTYLCQRFMYDKGINHSFLHSPLISTIFFYNTNMLKQFLYGIKFIIFRIHYAYLSRLTITKKNHINFSLLYMVATLSNIVMCFLLVLLSYSLYSKLCIH